MLKKIRHKNTFTLIQVSDVFKPYLILMVGILIITFVYYKK